MTCMGHVKNGAIVLDEAVQLPEGLVVTIFTRDAGQMKTDDAGPSLAERLAPIIGSIDGLPEDAAINHDHYLRRYARTQISDALALDHHFEQAGFALLCAGK